MTYRMCHEQFCMFLTTKLVIVAISKSNFTNSTAAFHSLYPSYFTDGAKVNKLAVSEMLQIHINILNGSRIMKHFVIFYQISAQFTVDKL